MYNSETNRLCSEKLFHRMVKFVVQYRYVFLGTFGVGLLAHMFAFTNKLPNHDDIQYLFSKGATLESGRWGLQLLSYIIPDVSMPWIYGILSLIFLSVGNCFLVKNFQIKNHFVQFLLGGMIVTFPSQTGVFAYMFTATAYAFSYLLAVLSLMLIKSGKKRYYPLAVLCLIGSLSIYQAYLGIVAGALIVALMNDVMMNTDSVKKIIFRGLFYIVFMAVALGLYWGITKLMLAWNHSDFGSYAMQVIRFSPETIMQGIKDAYVIFYGIPTVGQYGLVTPAFSSWMHLLCFGAVGIYILLYMLRCKKIERILLLSALIVLLPLGIGCISLFCLGGAIHALVLFSYIVVYLLFAGVLTSVRGYTFKKELLKLSHIVCTESLAIGMAAIMICNIYVANEVYLKLHLSYENTYFLATTVATQLQSSEGYSVEKKIAMIGTKDLPDYYENFQSISGLIGTGDHLPTMYALPKFFEYYVGVPLNWASQEECSDLMETTQYAQMPSYPNQGYILEIDGIFVIKLG